MLGFPEFVPATLTRSPALLSKATNRPSALMTGLYDSALAALLAVTLRLISVVVLAARTRRKTSVVPFASGVAERLFAVLSKATNRPSALTLGRSDDPDPVPPPEKA